MKLPTISDLIADLQHAKEIAIRNENASGLVLATMSQAKLLGLDKPITDVTNSNVPSGLGHFYGKGNEQLKPTVIRLVAPDMDDNGKVIK